MYLGVCVSFPKIPCDLLKIFSAIKPDPNIASIKHTPLNHPTSSSSHSFIASSSCQRQVHWSCVCGVVWCSTQLGKKLQLQNKFNLCQRLRCGDVLSTDNRSVFTACAYYLQPNASPVYRRPYPVFPVHLATSKKELDQRVEIGVLSPVDTEWGLPTFITPKKDGTVR